MVVTESTGPGLGFFGWTDSDTNTRPWRLVWPPHQSRVKSCCVHLVKGRLGNHLSQFQTPSLHVSYPSSTGMHTTLGQLRVRVLSASP